MTNQTMPGDDESNLNPPPIGRREQLRRQRSRNRKLVIAGATSFVLVAGGVAVVATRSSGTKRPTRPAAERFSDTATTAAQKQPNAIQLENAKKGTDGWRVPPGMTGLEGYANRTSAQLGDTVTLYVSSNTPTFGIEAYRMGWYQGLGGRFVWHSDAVKGAVQPQPTITSANHTVTADWQASYQLKIPNDWTPGDYLLKLISSASQSYIPLTVRDDSSNAPVVVVNAVTTWQAYNDWGGYSLYHGPAQSGSTRATVVSFDRPYARDGAGDFIANEHGLVSLAEHMGLDVTYITDVDVHERPELLQHHKVIVSLGHDEYWSLAMRNGVEAARDKGVNVMFLGANALYRRIRLQASTLGPDREEVNYRGVGNDPDYPSKYPDQPTTSWREPPRARPENSLTGTYYECNPVNVDGVVADASSWMLSGTNLKDGDHLKLLIGTEYDRVQPTATTPKNIEVLLHSPLRCQGHSSFADAGYYTVPSGAGVFDSGTGAWVCKLFSGCPADVPFAPDPVIQRITENILRVFAAGPAGLTHPAQSNVGALHESGSFGATDSDSGVSPTLPRRRYNTTPRTSETPPATNPPQTTPQTSPPKTTPKTTPTT